MTVRDTGTDEVRSLADAWKRIDAEAEDEPRWMFRRSSGVSSMRRRLATLQVFHEDLFPWTTYEVGVWIWCVVVPDHATAVRHRAAGVATTKARAKRAAERAARRCGVWK